MEFFLIYLFVMSSKIAAMFAFFGKLLFIPTTIMLGCTLFICGICSIDYGRGFKHYWEGEGATFVKRLAKWCMPIGLVFMMMSHLIPSEKQLAIIVGSGVTYNVLTSEPAKQIGGKALQLLQKKIDAALKETETETTEEKSVEKKDVSL
jgi:hypothetical protein